MNKKWMKTFIRLAEKFAKVDQVQSPSKGTMKRCSDIVRKEVQKRNIFVNDAVLMEITKDIISISIAHGGDDSSDMIFGFAQGYLDHGLYKKYLVGNC